MDPNPNISLHSLADVLNSFKPNEHIPIQYITKDSRNYIHIIDDSITAKEGIVGRAAYHQMTSKIREIVEFTKSQQAELFNKMIISNDNQSTIYDLNRIIKGYREIIEGYKQKHGVISYFFSRLFGVGQARDVKAAEVYLNDLDKITKSMRKDEGDFISEGEFDAEGRLDGKGKIKAKDGSVIKEGYFEKGVLRKGEIFARKENNKNEWVRETCRGRFNDKEMFEWGQKFQYNEHLEESFFSENINGYQSRIVFWEGKWCPKSIDEWRRHIQY